MTPRGLIGLITTSPNPDRLADFYRSAFGIPYALNQHGTMPPHYECDVNGIHFAIIKGARPPQQGTVVPSFEVDDLDGTLAVLEDAGTPRLHPIMELGGGPRICTVADPDGNHVRLYAPRSPTS
jgi:predicted enzyme related to lactoylglutathione lyase